MKHTFSLYSNDRQTTCLNRILGEFKYSYNLANVFNLLPEKIKYNNRVGYLKVSKIDISYSSLETEMQGSVVLLFQFMLNGQNVFDGLIEALDFIKNHKNEIEILEE